MKHDSKPPQALCAPYTGRRGVLDQPASPTLTRWIDAHWGKPATCAQALAALARMDAELARDAIQASHAAALERRESERKARKRSA